MLTRTLVKFALISLSIALLIAGFIFWNPALCLCASACGFAGGYIGRESLEFIFDVKVKGARR